MSPRQQRVGKRQSRRKLDVGNANYAPANSLSRNDGTIAFDGDLRQEIRQISFSSWNRICKLPHLSLWTARFLVTLAKSKDDQNVNTFVVTNLAETNMPNDELLNQDTKDSFVDLCSKFTSAMLVTECPNGTLIARPMMIAQLDNDGDIWFATDQHSGKIDDILTHPQVCVTLADGSDFASISGAAEVIKDRHHIHELWSEPWRVWFPDGPEDPRIVLIRVHAATGEFWSQSGTNRAKYLFEAAKAYLTGERPQVDEKQHARVKLD